MQVFFFIADGKHEMQAKVDSECPRSLCSAFRRPPGIKLCIVGFVECERLSTKDHPGMLLEGCQAQDYLSSIEATMLKVFLLALL